MINIVRILLVFLPIVLLNSYCTPKLLTQPIQTESKKDQTVYLLTSHSLEDHENERQKYVVFEENSLEIGEEGSDDIREIAVFSDMHNEDEITILCTTNNTSIQRAEQIKLLMTHFGVPDRSIVIVADFDTPLTKDNIIMIRINTKNVKQRDIAHSN